MKTEIQLKVIYKIKELRENAKISQAHLSDILDLNSYGSIGNIESPKFSNKYTLEQLQKLCDYFDYPLPKLFIPDEEIQKLDKYELSKILIKKIIEYGR